MPLGKLLLICCIAVDQTISESTYYWSDYTVGNFLPQNAYQPEIDLYIAKIAINGWELPASYDYFQYEAVTELNGKRLTRKRFSILCDPFTDDFYWEMVNVHDLTKDKLTRAIIGGRQSNNFLYIGKFYHENRWKIGAVFPPTSTLKGLRLLTENGNVYVFNKFEILMYNIDA